MGPAEDRYQGAGRRTAPFQATQQGAGPLKQQIELCLAVLGPYEGNPDRATDIELDASPEDIRQLIGIVCGNYETRQDWIRLQAIGRGIAPEKSEP